MDADNPGLPLSPPLSRGPKSVPPASVAGSGVNSGSQMDDASESDGDGGLFVEQDEAGINALRMYSDEDSGNGLVDDADDHPGDDSSNGSSSDSGDGAGHGPGGNFGSDPGHDFGGSSGSDSGHGSGSDSGEGPSRDSGGSSGGSSGSSSGSDSGGDSSGEKEDSPSDDVSDNDVHAELDNLRNQLQLAHIQLGQMTALHGQEKKRANNLQNRVNNLLAGKFRHTVRTWASQLRRMIDNLPVPPGGEAILLWDKIYKQCCKEENMSTSVAIVHPAIELVACRNNTTRCRDPFSEYRRKEQELPVSPAPQKLTFQHLPLDVQVQIFKLWLEKKDRLIHCFSRLDFYEAPAVFPSEAELGDRRSGLTTGFYWGIGRRCSLSQDCQEPDDVLRVLRVSKHWLELGAHVFYGLNTFAFSSLGEFHRFCKGIGQARVERLQHIEITFVGNQFLTAPRTMDAAGNLRAQPPFSLRTQPLKWLQECRRLRTLVIHINEQGKAHIRRRYESQDVVNYMAGKTAGQPNYRLTRSMRTVQGIDHLYQLRGMTWVRFYDLEQAWTERDDSRILVNDWSFDEDIMNVTTMEKVSSRRDLSELENLKPLVVIPDAVLPNWALTGSRYLQYRWSLANRLQVIKSLFVDRAGSSSYDEIRINTRDRNVRSRFTKSSDSTSSSSFDSLSGYDSSYSSDSSESSESESKPRFPSPTISSSSSSSSGSSSDGDAGGTPGTQLKVEDGTSESEDSEMEDASDSDCAIDEERSTRPGRSIYTSSPSYITYTTSSGPSPSTSGAPSSLIIIDDDDDEPEAQVPQTPRNMTDYIHNQPSVWIPGITTGTPAIPERLRSDTRESSALFVTPTPRALLATPDLEGRASSVGSQLDGPIDLTDSEDPIEGFRSPSESSSTSSKRSIDSLEPSEEGSPSKRPRLSVSPEGVDPSPEGI